MAGASSAVRVFLFVLIKEKMMRIEKITKDENRNKNDS